MPPALPARLCLRPRILFVGINPSLRSAAVGHHFAGPGNPFWRLLHAARLVPEPLTFADDVRLPEFGLALTNIVSRATRQADELSGDEYVKGRRRLAALIARIQPEVVAFVGSTVYRQFFGRGGGCGAKLERIGDARVFVVPNPSGRNAAYPGFADKLLWYRRLRRAAPPLIAGAPLRHRPRAGAWPGGRLRPARRASAIPPSGGRR